MKKKSHYLLNVTTTMNFESSEEITPMFDGKYAKSDGTGYLVPRYFEDDKEVRFICDFNGWIGENPFNYGFLISEKMRIILDKFETFGRFIKTKVLYKEEFLNFYVFELNLTSFSNIVDFETSTFCEWDELEKVGKEPHSINKFNDILDIEVEKEWWGWGFDRAVMKPEFKEVDCIDMPYPYGILISERLKNALEEAELTGFEIIPFPVEFEYME